MPLHVPEHLARTEKQMAIARAQHERAIQLHMSASIQFLSAMIDSIDNQTDIENKVDKATKVADELLKRYGYNFSQQKQS